MNKPSARPRRKKDLPEEIAATVMLVDDHPIWRSTVGQLLELASCEVVAEASDGNEVVALTLEHGPDVVIMDINLPNMNGIEATRALLAARPETKVLVLSSSDEREHVVEAVKAGASGYLVKTLGPAEVVEAVLRVKSGELVFPPALSGVVLEEFRRFAVHGPPAAPLRVIVADPAILSRRGLGQVLTEAGFIVTGQAETPAELTSLIESDEPDVAILDARIFTFRADPRATVGERISERFPNVGLLVLSAEADISEAAGFISEGRRGTGYLPKDRISDPAQIADAVRRIASGESVVDPQVVNRLVVDTSRTRGIVDVLTPREREVLALMAQGRSNQAIGENLFVGLKSVEGYVTNIYSKLGLEPVADDHRRVLAVIAYLRSS